MKHAERPPLDGRGAAIEGHDGREALVGRRLPGDERGDPLGQLGPARKSDEGLARRAGALGVAGADTLAHDLEADDERLGGRSEAPEQIARGALVELRVGHQQREAAGESGDRLGVDAGRGRRAERVTHLAGVSQPASGQERHEQRSAPLRGERGHRVGEAREPFDQRARVLAVGEKIELEGSRGDALWIEPRGRRGRFQGRRKVATACGLLGDGHREGRRQAPVLFAREPFRCDRARERVVAHGVGELQLRGEQQSSGAREPARRALEPLEERDGAVEGSGGAQRVARRDRETRRAHEALHGHVEANRGGDTELTCARRRAHGLDDERGLALEGPGGPGGVLGVVVGGGGEQLREAPRGEVSRRSAEIARALERDHRAVERSGSSGEVGRVDEEQRAPVGLSGERGACREGRLAQLRIGESRGNGLEQEVSGARVRRPGARLDRLLERRARSVEFASAVQVGAARRPRARTLVRRRGRGGERVEELPERLG
ncbi:MAG: hypothetical protein IPQ09_06305 [Myxococcales bacterium]|nr:hypothetical protein [Myxococcales bacterium]